MSITTAVDCLSRGDFACFANSVRSTVESFINDPVGAVANAIDAISAGASMIVDDIMDFGMLDRVHHWLVGLIVLVLGIIALVVVIILIIMKPF
jgi:hypothetical protein